MKNVTEQQLANILSKMIENDKNGFPIDSDTELYNLVIPMRYVVMITEFDETCYYAFRELADADNYADNKRENNDRAIIRIYDLASQLEYSDNAPTFFSLAY